MCTGIEVRKPDGKDNWGDPHVDGMIILRLIESRDLHRFLVRNPDLKRPLGRPRRR
jgi:hypothetical protein